MARPSSSRGRFARRAALRVVTLIVVIGLGLGCGLEPDSEGEPLADRDQQLQRVVEQVVDLVLVPAYAGLAAGTAALPTAASTFCATRDGPSLEALQQGWLQAMAAWQAAQLVSFGPIDERFRAIRIQRFPERSITVADSVESVLSSGATIDEEFVSELGVEVQGLPALEYLLFEPEGDVLSAYGATTEGDRRCQLVQAISANLRTIAAEVDHMWREPFCVSLTEPVDSTQPVCEGSGGSWQESSWSELVKTAEKGNSEFDDREEVLSELITSVLFQLEVIGDDKIDTPRSTSRPERLESWRSRSSLRNIYANLSAVERLYRGGDGYGIDDFLADDIRTETVDEDVAAALSAVLAATRTIEVPLYEALDLPEEQVWIDALWQGINTLRTLFEDRVRPALGARVLFTSNDGD